MEISIFSAHALAVTRSGRVFSWGKGDEGRLGHGSTDSIAKPRLITTLQSKFIIQARAGLNFSAFLDKDGYVYCCGNNKQGQVCCIFVG